MSEHAVLTLGSGIFVGILGALIKYAGMTFLIAGYDPERVDDEEELADFIGTNTLYVAFLTIGMGVVEYLAPTMLVDWHWGVFALGIIALAIRMIRGARQYESSPNRE